MDIEMTLCYKCRRDFEYDTDVKISMINLKQKYKDLCCICQIRLGYDYLIQKVKCAKK